MLCAENWLQACYYKSHSDLLQVSEDLMGTSAFPMYCRDWRVNHGILTIKINYTQLRY